MKNSSTLLPIAIILAGALIAGSIISVKRQDTDTNSSIRGIEAMAEINSNDHIFGDPDAPIKIVEYSDTECPYCQQFHNTLKRTIESYKDDKVVWIFRHLPFHEKSLNEAIATECAGKLGGKKAFWDYLDQVFNRKDFTKNPYIGIEASLLPSIAKEIGLDKDAFTACLSDKAMEDSVKEDMKDAAKIGITTTPYTIIVTKNQKIKLDQGAIPFEDLKTIIDLIDKSL